MSPRIGRLLSVEGVTGAGKSTLLRRLRRALPARSFFPVGGYRAPSEILDPFHRDLLRAIRRQVARNEFLRLDWKAECLALQAELLLSQSTIVEPTLARGKTIVYEHHQDSIYAYQAARLVELGETASVERGLSFVRGILGPFEALTAPLATLFLDVEPRLASRRAARRDNRRLTTEARKFNNHVHEAYEILYVTPDPKRPIFRVATIEEAIPLLRDKIFPAETQL